MQHRRQGVGSSSSGLRPHRTSFIPRAILLSSPAPSCILVSSTSSCTCPEPHTCQESCQDVSAAVLPTVEGCRPAPASSSTHHLAVPPLHLGQAHLGLLRHALSVLRAHPCPARRHRHTTYSCSTAMASTKWDVQLCGSIAPHQDKSSPCCLAQRSAPSMMPTRAADVIDQHTGLKPPTLTEIRPFQSERACGRFSRAACIDTLPYCCRSCRVMAAET